MNDLDTALSQVNSDSPLPEAMDLLDVHLASYDVAVTEHVAIDAEPAVVFEAAKNFDFMTTRSPVVAALMAARSIPSRLLGRQVVSPRSLMLATESGSLPGWLVLGEVPGREVAFGAVGTFWRADIAWHDLAGQSFAAFAEPGWGKIACHLLVRPNGAGRSILSYECRTATTDPISRARMARYWWLIRPFVSYVLRAVLRTIRGRVEGA